MRSLPSLVLLVVVVGILTTSVTGQTYAPCVDGSTKAVECIAVNRICLGTDGVEECGNCQAGYIEFKRKQTGCLFIDDLPWETFLENLDESPKYRDETKYTNEERLQFLYNVLQFISNFSSTIPPPAYELAPNKFSADSTEEYKQLLGVRLLADQAANEAATADFGRFGQVNLDNTRRERERLVRRRLQELPETLPPKVDWEELGGVTAVKDQGRCGSCWAFSVMGAVEGATFITESFIQSMSVQQLISCDKQNYGCDGGNIVMAMGYAWQNRFGGVTDDNNYPYTDSGGDTTETCKIASKELTAVLENPVVVVDYYDNITYDERMKLLKSAVARQPVSINMKSNCLTFQNYNGGIMDNDGDCRCEKTSCIDHAILLVGYDDTTTPKSWKCKNTWGSGWGENGYFRIAQSDTEADGIWGLFAVMGEGVIPLEAYNTTQQEVDQNNYDDNNISLTWWQIFLIVLAGLAALCCVGCIIQKFMCRK